jgi:hypothetical protein
MIGHDKPCHAGCGSVVYNQMLLMTGVVAAGQLLLLYHLLCVTVIAIMDMVIQRQHLGTVFHHIQLPNC